MPDIRLGFFSEVGKDLCVECANTNNELCSGTLVECDKLGWYLGGGLAEGVVWTVKGPPPSRLELGDWEEGGIVFMNDVTFTG